LTQLLIVKSSVNKKPEFFRQEIQKELYKWISLVGINVNNCPEKLKTYLFTVNEILEGRGESFVNQTKELVKDVKIAPQDALKFFKETQEHLSKSDKRKKVLEGKNWNELGEERRLGGDMEMKKGKEFVELLSPSDVSFYQSNYYGANKTEGVETHSGPYEKELNEAL